MRQERFRRSVYVSIAPDMGSRTYLLAVALTAFLGGCAVHTPSRVSERASVSAVMAEPVQNGNRHRRFAIELGAGDTAGRLVYAHAVASGAYPNRHAARVPGG
jgi:hypothetical protein